MQIANSIAWNKSLVFRSVMTAFALSAIVLISTNYYRFHAEQNKKIAYLVEEERELVSILNNTINLALWNLDIAQINQQINALLKNEDIFCGIRVHDAHDNTIAEVGHWPQDELSESQKITSYPILFNDPRNVGNAQKPIGNLEICADYLKEITDIRSDMLFHIMMSVILSMVLALICFLSMMFFVVPLKRFRNAIRKFTENHEPINDPALLKNNEIGILGMSFNQMAAELTLYHDELLIAKEKAVEANKSKTEFLSNMSHELRTPMHAILNYSEMSARRLAKTDDATTKRFVDNIHTSGQRLLTLLNNLLDLSKLDAGKKKLRLAVGNVHDAIKQCLIELESLTTAKNIRISITETDTATEHPLLHDKNLLIQVFVNILSNAIKFSEGNAPAIKITYALSGDNLQCSIANQGLPIPENELESIFDPFAQSSVTKTGAGGTGLGLSICRQIMQMHNGKIWAENRDGWVVFHILLPIKQ